jgi:hypothetical protein
MTHSSTKGTLAALVAAAVCAAPAQAAPPQMHPPEPNASVREVARVEAPASGLLTLPARCHDASRLQLRIRMSIRWPRTGACVHGSAVRFNLGRKAARRLAGHSTRAVLTIDGASRAFKLGAAGAKARATADAWDASRSWTDATLDCYPVTGGRLGGGTNNTSVHLSVLWKFPVWTWVSWQVHLEMYVNGTHLWQWDYPAATNHWWGPYQAGPQGMSELSDAATLYDGSSARQYNPWSEEFTFLDRVIVRAWVGLATYGNGWSQTTWHPARALHPAYGYQPGYCAI